MSFQSPVPIPERVQSQCEGPIQTLSDYTEATRLAKEDPSAFWLAETRRSIVWRTEPSVGLEGSFHSVAETPLSWFRDGTLNVTES